MRKALRIDPEGKGPGERRRKAAGSDERKKKATYPACHGLDASKQKARMLIDETKRRLSPLGPPAAPLLAPCCVSSSPLPAFCPPTRRCRNGGS